MRRHRAGLLAATLVLAACGVADDAIDPTSATSAQPGSDPSGSDLASAAPASPGGDATEELPGASATFDVGPTPEASMSPSLLAVVVAASADVRTRTKDLGQVQVVSAEEGPVRQATLDWCAARGTTVEDPSFRVVLGIDDRVWVYLAGADGEPVLCPTDEPDEGTEFLPPPGIDD